MTGRRRNRSASQISRDRKLIALFSTILLASAATLGYRLAFDQGPPVQTVEADVPLGADGRLSIQFLGDTMLGDESQEVLDVLGYDWPLAGVAPLLDGDHIVANLEAPLTLDDRPYLRAKEYSYAANPAAAGALARAGIDSVGLGNNHAMDAGPQGLADTYAHAAAAGLAAFGAGQDLTAAERPLILRSEIGDIGVVALGENFGKSSRAAEAAPGTVVLKPESVQRGVDLARAAGAAWVIAYVHWGDNYVQVNEQQRYWARMLVDAGYDMVIGTGPHIAQPIEVIDSVPVAYSLGNFVFGAPGRFESYDVPGIGLSVTVGLTRGSTPTLSVRCLLTDNKIINYQPVACTPEVAKAVLPAYNPGLMVWGNVGLMSCTCFARGSRG